MFEVTAADWIAVKAKLEHYSPCYGVWSEKPKGSRPNFTKCAASVDSKGGWGPVEHQCTRPCGHGPDGAYCKQHAKSRITV